MIPQPLTTDLVRVQLRNRNTNRTLNLWARELKVRPDGTRLFLKVDKTGEVPSTYSERTNVVTETREIFVAAPNDVWLVAPAFMSLKYGELTTSAKED
jgi:hypothetical protein